MEVWGGLECSINRVGSEFFDQLEYSGHYNRPDDICTFVDLGIKKMRYPVLWETHQPLQDVAIEWHKTGKRLKALRKSGIDIIAGLVHHGSGPNYVSMLDDSFAEGLSAYATRVAEEFPWINYYTPVNEPLTTARFCGLYGLWYPHQNNDQTFCRILINECKATVLAMQCIRKINPAAKLVQTDDLGKIHSTSILQYQADFENDRRWLTFDLLCGTVKPGHAMWDYLVGNGISGHELVFFTENVCKPDIIGLNHYLTSERYLDDNIDGYPAHTHGNNGRIIYADVEAVRVGTVFPNGPYQLLREAWDRYRIPIAVTEVHLHCTREDQMRWLNQVWNAANQLHSEGVDIIAVTPWALLGSYGWNRLLTEPHGYYEPGVFDLSSGKPRATALTRMISGYSKQQFYQHPVLESDGWWQRQCRVIYGDHSITSPAVKLVNVQPILITGKTGTLGNTFARICEMRGISCQVLSREEMDITNAASIDEAFARINPWAVINTAGYARVDLAEVQADNCYAVNTEGPKLLAAKCERLGIKLMTFSSDLVFNGLKGKPYLENDDIAPLNIYGHSKAKAEAFVIRHNPSALIIRTSVFFGPWDDANFLKVAINRLQNYKTVSVASDVMFSPAYLPDLVNASLDLLIDDESGIWHLNNSGQISWENLAYSVAERLRLDTSLISPMPLSKLGYKAYLPHYRVLNSDRGNLLGSLDSAVDRFIGDITNTF